MTTKVRISQRKFQLNKYKIEKPTLFVLHDSENFDIESIFEKEEILPNAGRLLEYIVKEEV